MVPMDRLLQIVERLDFLEGSISRITAESVKFQYDEQIMDVPRSRLEGIVLLGNGVRLLLGSTTLISPDRAEKFPWRMAAVGTI